jgi:hypothetical protein
MGVSEVRGGGGGTEVLVEVRLRAGQEAQWKERSKTRPLEGSMWAKPIYRHTQRRGEGA